LFEEPAMTFPVQHADRRPDDDWRDHLPPYGQPVAADTPPRPALAPAPAPAAPPARHSRLGTWLLALGLGAAITAVAISNLQDPRSLGTQLDDAIRQARGVGSDVQETVMQSQTAATEASRDALQGVSTALDDSAISLKVKTALAADPALSAARIDVTTSGGIVRLEGPAPDAVSKERATVLASAPRGVKGVDNRLALPQPGKVVSVVEPANR
jgi:hypothetical protein